MIKKALLISASLAMLGMVSMAEASIPKDNQVPAQQPVMPAENKVPAVVVADPVPLVVDQVPLLKKKAPPLPAKQGTGYNGAGIPPQNN
ncbi:MAG: hypothetical protein NTX76_01950 [Alphaproteobacteria bacterium]|nr:hypothetical protein [Alphaproteobacteria bacterium]